MPQIRRTRGRDMATGNWAKFNDSKQHRAKEFKPVAEGQQMCPHCKAGVRLIKAPFTDKEMGITAKTKMIKSHRFGGGNITRGNFPCPGSYVVAKENENDD